MPTKVQFDCFQSITDREVKRHERLIDRGKVYLSLVTLYIGLVGVAAEKVIPKIMDHPAVVFSYILSLLSGLGATAYVIFALGIFHYRSPIDLSVVYKSTDELASDEVFLDRRMADLAAAFRPNMEVDERRWRYLRKASKLLLLALTCYTLVLAALPFIGFNPEKNKMNSYTQENVDSALLGIQEIKCQMQQMQSYLSKLELQLLKMKAYPAHQLLPQVPQQQQQLQAYAQHQQPYSQFMPYPTQQQAMQQQAMQQQAMQQQAMQQQQPTHMQSLNQPSSNKEQIEKERLSYFNTAQERQLKEQQQQQ